MEVLNMALLTPPTPPDPHWGPIGVEWEVKVLKWPPPDPP